MNTIITVLALLLCPGCLWIGHIIYSRGIDTGARLAGREGTVSREDLGPDIVQETTA